MINGFVIGDDALAARLLAASALLTDGLGRRVAQFAFDLRSRIEGDWLAGGVIQRRSGRLADSLEIREGPTGDGLTMSLAATAPYAAFQEFGFTGAESVTASLRAIREAFGRPLKVGAKEIVVRAYTRDVDYPAHSFLRAALDDMAGDLADSLGEGTAEILGGIAP